MRKDGYIVRVIKVHKTNPPPKKTPRRFTVELTEGEADLILGLLATANATPSVKVGSSPFKYVKRLVPVFEKLLGQKADETDAFINSVGVSYFNEYGRGQNWTY